MPKHKFTKQECSKGGKAVALKPPPGPCPKCGKSFSTHAQYAGHLGLHAYAERWCGGDMKRAVSEFVQMGQASTDPIPENGAFADGHKILARFK